MGRGDGPGQKNQHGREDERARERAYLSSQADMSRPP